MFSFSSSQHPSSDSVATVRRQDVLDSGKHLTLQEVQQQIRIVSAPSARHWRARLRGVALLEQAALTPTERELVATMLIAVLENTLDGDTRHERQRHCLHMGWMTVCVALLPAFLASISLWDWTEIAGLATILITLVLFSPWMLHAAYLDREDYHINRVRACAASALGRLAWSSAVGALACAALDFSRRVRGAALPALIITLPTLTPEHYGTLGPDAVPALCRLLRSGEEALMVRILDAIAIIGDARALPTVKNMVAQGQTTAIREAAARALPRLQARMRLETEPRILLRSASAPALDASFLVRSTNGTDSPEWLLRSVGVVSEPSSEMLRPQSVD